jgi:hypothetical protein
MLKRIFSSFIFVLLASLPARSETFSDYFVSAKDFQAEGNRIFDHKTIQKAATFQKLRIDGRVRSVKETGKFLRFEEKLERTGLKTISGFRFYNTTYKVGSRKYKGDVLIKVSYELKDDAQGNGKWTPRLQYYSIAYKPGSRTTKPRFIAVKCDDVLGS